MTRFLRALTHKWHSRFRWRPSPPTPLPCNGRGGQPPPTFFPRLFKHLVFLWLCFFVMPLQAQDALPSVINAENVASLKSGARIDFEGTTLDTGWFFMNQNGTRFVTRSATELYVWEVDADGEVSSPRIFPMRATTMTVAAFAPDDTLYGVLQGDKTEIIRIDDQLTTVRVLEGWSLMNLWADEEALWAEAFSNALSAEEMILRIPYDVEEEITTLPYAPGEDLDAVVRIGRIAAPYTVTSTETGRVSIWNLSTALRLHETDTGVGQAAVFGAMNTPATHLIWRDDLSEALYWLDLETGENQLVDRLDGDYVQWLFLTPDADVILGIDKGFEERVTAWIVGGETLDLGPYLDCKRPQPDMAVLSVDGTTLAIGCDSGVDIWRVSDE